MLQVNEIEVFFGALQVLWGVSFELDEKETVSLLGSNGAGKTTTVSGVAGVIPISRGLVQFEGQDVTQLPAHKRVEAGLVLVPEGRRIFPSLSVLENLELGSFLKGPKSHRQESLDRVMSMFPILKERKDQAAGTLSGGEQQMLALGRGLMSMPRLLILDEPSLGLAPIIVDEIFHSVSAINDEGVTVLLVEQNAPQALSISNRAYVLEEGKVVLSGTGEDLSKNDHIRRVYLGVTEEQTGAPA
ncbi:MAG: ABC transporter ATP-binding protein [Desulfobacteraceae bacterium]